MFVVGERVGDDLHLAGVLAVIGPQRDDVELLGRIGRIVALDHVDDDHGDVVASAGLVRRVDEGLRRLVRIGVLEQEFGDVIVRDLVDEAVGAEQDAVALEDRHRPRVDADTRFDTERAGDDVAARVVSGLLAGDRPLGHQLLDEAVVDRQLAQSGVAHHVAT